LLGVSIFFTGPASAETDPPIASPPTEPTLREGPGPKELEEKIAYLRLRLIWRVVQLIALAIPLALILCAMYLAERIGFTGSMQLAWSYTIWATRKAGPVFIKFAQWIATRPDVFPEKLCRRCSEFQSGAPSHSWAKSVEILTQNFGPEWASVLEITDRTPLGTGCLCQVYKGKLLVGDGEKQEIAIKIVHPDVRRKIRVDLSLLRVVLKFLERIPVARDYLRWNGVDSAVSEFETMMVEQMDLRIEAKNLQRFGENFKDIPNVTFPRVYTDHVTADVLVESFEAGKCIDQYFDAPPPLKKHLADVGIDAFLKMLFEDSFFHDDLHPGNILVRENGPNLADHELVFLDCGIAREFTGNYIRNFLDLFAAICNSNGELAGRLIYERSPSSSECTDPEGFAKEVQELVNSVDVLRLKLAGVGQILGRVAQICVEYKVQLEGNYASVVVAVLVLEGVGRHLNPELELLKVLTNHLLTRASREVVSTFRQSCRQWVQRTKFQEWGPF